MPLPKGYSLTTKGQSLLDDPNKFLGVPSREEIEVEKEDFAASEQLFSEWDWQNEQQLGPQGEALPELAIGWKPDGSADFGTGLKGFWNKAVSNFRSSWLQGYQEGIKITYNKYNEETGQREDVTKEFKAEDKNQAYWFAAMEGTKSIFNSALWGVLEGLGQVPLAAEQALGSTAYAIADTIEGRDINWKRNWEASRMLYSGLFDA